MENVWEKLKSLKGRSWIETKDILNKIVKDIPQVEDIVIAYNVNSETLPAEDREIYGVYPKSEPFYLERCKLCTRLLKPSVLNHHYDLHHKRNINNVKKTSFVSRCKKKHGKKGNKSTSEDDSESVISSETPSPAIDSLETQSNDSNTGTIRDDSIIDVISVDEIPSEESKPPTPGPQDFYEEFAVPFAEEVNVISSSVETGDSSKPTYSNCKSVLKLKVSASKDSNGKTSSTTSLLEAHLLSNTKYNTAGISNSDAKYRNPNYKFGATFAKNESKGIGSDLGLRKSEEVDQNESWKTPFNQVQTVAGSPKFKTETKISIPISVLPQNVKIIGSLKKPVASKPSQLLIVGQNSVSNLDSVENCIGQLPSSPLDIETDANTPEISMSNGLKEKSTKSKRNKRSKAKNRSAKSTEFDPNKHCGVLIDENRHCMRSLTCKTHAIALRRAVEGRSKEFDKLLADHRASKEALKEQERGQGNSLSESTVSIPVLNADKISGNAIQVPPANNDPDIIKIRVPNVNSNSELTSTSLSYEKSQVDVSLKIETEMTAKKIPFNLKTAIASGVKPLNIISKVSQNASSFNGEVKPQIYDSDIKISFVCSDMLYKVGGLLCTDRSRQAIRKCMEPLMSNTKPKNQLKRPVDKQKITDFLQLVKNYGAPPAKLHLFKDDKTGNVLTAVRPENMVSLRNELTQKAHEELERMKSVLSNSTKILNNLAADENEMKKFRLSTKLKRKGDHFKHIGGKKIKQESISDENYDINTLLSFDKCITKTEDIGHHFPVIPSDGYAFTSMGNVPFGAVKNGDVQPTDNVSGESNIIDSMPYEVYLNRENGNVSGYAENETVQLIQTYKDLENEIRNTVGPHMQELYPTQQIQTNSYINYIDPNSAQGSMEFKSNCENEFKVQLDNHMPSIEETISKNYSLLEEYCKNIPTDEFFLDNKNDLEFYDNNGAVNVNNMKLNKNEVIVVNDSMYGSDRAATEMTNSNAVDSLNFDTQLLNTYLSSISADATNQSANEMNFVGGRPFDIPQDQPLSKEQVYEEILTLNKQFQDSAAVNIEKPPTPNPVVYAETENDEVFKWLY